MKEPEDGSRRRFLRASSMLGLAAAFSPGTMIEAFAGSKSRINEEDNMTQTSATQPDSEQAADKTAMERTLEGIEAINMIRKGQVKRLAGSEAQGQAKFVASLFGVAA